MLSLEILIDIRDDHITPTNGFYYFPIAVLTNYSKISGLYTMLSY